MSLRSSFLCVLCLVTVSIGAIDIPLVLKWDSANSIFYAPPQTTKKISWSEFYRTGIGLDSLSINDTYASFLIQNHANFITNQLKLHSFELGYKKDKWQISGTTEPIGYGARNTLNLYHFVSPDMDDFPYQATRFNGIKLIEFSSTSSIGLAVGGSVHNQAIGWAQYAYLGGQPRYTINLKQEVRGQDNHWRSPVSISSLRFSYQKYPLLLNTETAYSYFVAMNKTTAHGSVYALGEVDLIVLNNLTIYALAEIKQVEPSSDYSQRYQCAASTALGQIIISPGVLHNVMEHHTYNKAYISADYYLNPSMRFGLIYGYEGSNLSSGKHSLGIQSSLSYDL